MKTPEGHLVHFVFDDSPWEDGGDDFIAFTRALKDARRVTEIVGPTVQGAAAVGRPR
jgi:hypothetical protein